MKIEIECIRKKYYNQLLPATLKNKKKALISLLQRTKPLTPTGDSRLYPRREQTGFYAGFS